MPTHHSPTTSNTASTPTQGRPPGSAQGRPDDWTRQFFANGYATGRATFSPGYYLDQQHDVITAPAPQVELPAPTLTVLERGDGAITGTLVDYSNGLPSIPGRTVTPRPAGFIPPPSTSGTRPPFTVELKFAPADRPRGPRRTDPFTCSPARMGDSKNRDCRLNGGTGWSEIREESDHD